MARLRQRRLKRYVVHLEQEGTCLLCDYPLLLGCHLHHVIASDDRGPDHLLNLVGLCPNHHLTLECVRRRVAPKETHGAVAWQEHAEAALKVIGTLPDERRRLFNKLTEPHPLRKEMREGVDPELRTALAYDIAQKDLQLLLQVNEARPLIVLIWRIKQGETPEPRTDADWEKAISAITATLRPADFQSVVALHLSALGLPFEPAWLNAGKL